MRVEAGPNARDRIWTAIRSFAREPFTLAQVIERAGVRPRTADSYLQQFRRAGYVAQAGRRERPKRRRGEARHRWWREMRYVLVRDTGVETPRLRADGSPGTGGLRREQLWRAARILREFDARELCAAASTPQCQVAYRSARAFAHMLMRAGILACSSPGASGKHTRYRIVPAMVCGPRPPVWRRSGEVFDPNTGRVLWPR
jgi:hypothetical protein